MSLITTAIAHTDRSTSARLTQLRRDCEPSTRPVATFDAETASVDSSTSTATRREPTLRTPQGCYFCTGMWGSALK